MRLLFFEKFLNYPNTAISLSDFGPKKKLGSLVDIKDVILSFISARLPYFFLTQNLIMRLPFFEKFSNFPKTAVSLSHFGPKKKLGSLFDVKDVILSFISARLPHFF